MDKDLNKEIEAKQQAMFLNKKTIDLDKSMESLIVFYSRYLADTVASELNSKICVYHGIGANSQQANILFNTITTFFYLSVEEFNAWADGGVLAERNAQWKEVLASYADKVRPFVDGDTLIDGLAIAMLAPGHTPGHTVYRVGNCLFVGDLVHAEDLQLSYPDFCARYDGDYPQAVMTRKKMIDYATDNRLLMCGAHCYTQPIIIDGSK